MRITGIQIEGTVQAACTQHGGTGWAMTDLIDMGNAILITNLSSELTLCSYWTTLFNFCT